MANDTIVFFADPAFRDELSDLVREGARRIIAQAVEAELKGFLEAHSEARDGLGGRAVVRNGYQPRRQGLTGVGPVKVRLPKTRDRGGEGRCFRTQVLPPYLKKTRMHKTVNVLDKLPKRLQGPAQSARHEIWQADSRAAADKAFDRFVATYEDKYPRAVDCLAKDRAAWLAFYHFPAAHFPHIRTTNPIESTFATIRLRTRKTRNCVSARSGLSLMHQLAMSAQKRWRRLRGFRQLADVVAGVKFVDGIDRRKISRKAA